MNIHKNWFFSAEMGSVISINVVSGLHRIKKKNYNLDFLNWICINIFDNLLF